ncbi:response regulator transcription factor [Zhouia sp. PK063]|uniref:response regulator transcription factor n=1 Tax=Zhouia sp. PK063 TaxID=3373602 RepID=UPI0037B3D203
MKQILVIDDKAALSDLVAQFLSRTFDVTTKANGLEALAWLQQSHMPDLIITDLQMPEMGGLEFIENIKQSGFFSEIPVMVLSCKSGSNDRIACLKAGAADYMVKPFNPEELLIRIENILQNANV